MRDEAGRIKYMAQFPQVAIARHQLQALKAFLQEFGMTPSSRSGIDFGPSDEFDEHEAFLRECRAARYREPS